ncbi:MAG: hypothetical protein ACOC8Q_01190 [Desulfosalsimonas sp.]
MNEPLKTGLIMATYLEAKPFVAKIRWKSSAEKPFPVYYAKGLALVISGIGKANAAAACAWLSAVASPEYIVNIGAAGANLDGWPLGSIYLIREALDTDRKDFKTGRPLCLSPDIMEGFETACLATSDTPVIEPEERRKASAFAELSDMEGAAVVQAAQKFKTRCLVIKFISDTLQHTTGRQIAANLRQYREPAFTEICGIMGF